MSFKKKLKKFGKKLKKAGQKLTKAIGKVAPVLSIIPGVGAIAGGAISAVANQANKLLSKGGKYTQNMQKQLDAKAQELQQQFSSGTPRVDFKMPTVQPMTTVENDKSPNLPDSSDAQGPPSFEVAEPTAARGGMDGKTVALIAAAGVAVLFLMRKR